MLLNGELMLLMFHHLQSAPLMMLNHQLKIIFA